MATLDKVLLEFYKTDELLAKARKVSFDLEYEYGIEWDKHLLGQEAMGLGTMALREAFVRSLLRENGIYLKRAEAEFEVRNLYTKWQTLKQIISAQISLQYEKSYG